MSAWELARYAYEDAWGFYLFGAHDLAADSMEAAVEILPGMLM